MKHCGRHHVQLDDGTCWAVDRDDTEEHSLEWVLRYGTPERIVEARMTLASILGSYKALINKPQRRRNGIVRDLRAALDSWPCAGQGGGK